MLTIPKHTSRKKCMPPIILLTAPGSATAMLYFGYEYSLSIHDADDHAPVFNRPEYIFAVYENRRQGQMPMDFNISPG